MKGYSTFPKSLGLESHHHMQFSVISMTALEGRIALLQRYNHHNLLSQQRKRKGYRPINCLATLYSGICKVFAVLYISLLALIKKMWCHNLLMATLRILSYLIEMLILISDLIHNFFSLNFFFTHNSNASG